MSIFNFLKRKEKGEFCSTCGKIHEGFSLSFIQPFCDLDLNSEGTYLTDDLCVINNEDYFIRVILEIPIMNHAEPFLWGVWVSQSKENFEFYKENFDKNLEGRHTFGWFSNVLPGYENTLNLKTQSCFQEQGTRPIIEIGECDHQLYKDFIHGITLKRAQEIMKISLKK